MRSRIEELTEGWTAMAKGLVYAYAYADAVHDKELRGVGALEYRVGGLNREEGRRGWPCGCAMSQSEPP